MNRPFLTVLLGALAMSATARHAACAPPPGDARAVLAVLEKVADWQLQQPDRHATDDWTYGALYTGMMALGQVSPKPDYHAAMMAMGEKHGWKPAKRVYHADDHCVSQTYLELYLLHQDPKMIAPTRERFDYIMANPQDDNLKFGQKGCLDKWSWCDALFMAPTAWTRMYTVTGDRRYLDFMNRLWWVTTDYLYDKEEHLYYRDDRYFDKREENGRKVFWSRGNGWVIAGIVRVLQFLPADYPDRPKYLTLYREMAEAVRNAQQPDGLWRSSLLDPVAYPLKETSGSGFYTYALTWGINQGLLDRKVYEPVVRKAWAGLAACVRPDGKLGNVQPIGADPKKFDEEHSDVYGVGAFLLAGSEIFRLDGGQPPPRAYGRYVPERKDDFAWENDRIAFRVYGPALEATGEIGSGIDVWVKCVRYPVIDRWYPRADYHKFHGEGLDGYKVGPARGCGGTAILVDGAMVPSKNWTAYKVLENGPERVVFELSYAPWKAGARTIRETKRIELALGSNFNRIESRFESDPAGPMDAAVGIVLRKGDGRIFRDPALGAMAYWEPEMKPNGHTGCAVVADPARIAGIDEAEEHLRMRFSLKPGEPLVYYAGAGWSGSGDFADAAAWERYVKAFAAEKNKR